MPVKPTYSHNAVHEFVHISYIEFESISKGAVVDMIYHSNVSRAKDASVS